jgi:hypothetical protein
MAEVARTWAMLQALPSVSLADLAQRVGCSLDVLLDYARAELLPIYAQLNGVSVVVPRREAYHSPHLPPLPLQYETLNGLYRVPPASLPAVIEDRLLNVILVGETSDDARLAGVRLRAEELRVKREDANRVAAELGQSECPADDVAPAAVEEFRNARQRGQVLAKERCQTFGLALWSTNKSLRYDDIIQHPAFDDAVLRGDRHGWDRKTYVGWLKEVAPPEATKPGRPPKSTA